MKNIILFSLITICNIHAMEIFSLHRHKDAISAPAIVGVSLIGIGFWKGIESFMSMGPDQTIKEVTTKKILDDSLATVGIGFSILILFTSNQHHSYVNGLIK